MVLPRNTREVSMEWRHLGSCEPGGQEISSRSGSESRRQALIWNTACVLFRGLPVGSIGRGNCDRRSKVNRMLIESNGTVAAGMVHSEFQVKPEGWHQHGAAVTIVSRVDDILQARSHVDTAPNVCVVERFDNIFATVA